jgi:hypothetical protein
MISATFSREIVTWTSPPPARQCVHLQQLGTFFALSEYILVILTESRAALVQKVEEYLDNISLFITRCVVH